MDIAVIGLGYVGLSNALLLSKNNNVSVFDINNEKLKQIENNSSPILEKEMIEYFNDNTINLNVLYDLKECVENKDYIIIAVPTNFDEKTNSFNTAILEDVVNKVLEVNNKGTIIIRSTIPVGYTDYLRTKYNYKKIYFSPEFLRESCMISDNLYPSRIVVGGKEEEAVVFANLLKSIALKNIPVLLVDSKEAESIKLFSNTYLAMRVSFFNEVDTFSEVNNLNTEEVIKGISLDERIGNFYNNPSFGYGGYCLPKDTKQLRTHYEAIPENLITAIIKSNETRKKHIVEMILNKKPKCVGIYKLASKKDSTNFRESAVIDIMNLLSNESINVIICEPMYNEKLFDGFEIVNDLELFLNKSDVIIANRLYDELNSVKDKVYTRDVFNKD